MYFSFGNFNSELNIDKRLIFTRFNFSVESNINQFCDDVDRLIDIINTKKIDLILVNPFYSFFPAFFAAQITSKKIMYIYHGMASFNFPSNMIDTILFRYAFETTIKKVFCVSYQGINAFKTINYDNAVFLPNPIDEKKFKENNIKPNKTWALIARLDVDKKSEILKFLDLLPSLDINKIDIYGAGSEEQFIHNYILEKKLESKVELKGYSSQINKDLNNKYTGVIGLGRVAIEGLAMNYPVFLIGHNKIVGIIDKQLYEKLNKYNFVPNYCESLSKDEIKKQIKDINNGDFSKYQFRNKIINDFGIKKFIAKFEYEVKNIEFNNRQNIVNLYFEIMNLSHIIKDEKFYQSQSIYSLLIKYIASYTNDFNLKTNFNQFNYIFRINYFNENMESINNQFELIKNEFELIKQENSFLNEQLKHDNDTIKNIYNSTSWRLTKPLRKLKIIIKKFIRRVK